MNQNICYNCGGEYVLRKGRRVCAYCGSNMPEMISGEESTLLFNAFQRLRLAEFADAEQDFDDIIRRYPRNANAYWGRLMARYGIKYERDYDGKQIPTCYAASIESIWNAEDYRKAVEYADEESRAVFRAHAEYIESVRLEWLDKASREKPYDIFISYKDSDAENGIDRTADSDEMRELYIYLLGKGYRVFFSRESLRGKAGEKYEPYIYGALSTAKVMLVYASKPGYANATWVKNEWSRCQRLIRAGAKHPDSLIVAYKGFSPKELPLALCESGRQHLDASKPGFYDEFLEAVARITEQSDALTAPLQPTPTPSPAEKPKDKPLSAQPSQGLRFSYNGVLLGIGSCTDSDIVTPKGTFGVCERAFADCAQITGLYVPHFMDRIDRFAFENCENLKYLTVDNNLDAIGEGAFRDCAALEKVTIRDSRGLLIVQYAFYGCSSLREVTLPASVTGIGPYAFGMCRALTRIRFKGKKKDWKNIHLHSRWRAKSAIREVECADGTIKFLF
ncbi:MAG: leucine-rich repeat protein [Clostridia bacterium]|nr:leucine-rich repeat protein [Clostridia bacterium]